MTTKTIKAGLRTGLTNEEILAAVRKKHPKSEMTLATINYLRNQIRKTDKTVPNNRVARRKRAGK